MKKLALLLPLLALAAAGCGERSQYVAAEIERDITNADHSESVEIRVPQSRKPLYYATTWLFCTEESSAEFYRDLTGPQYKSEFRHPDEGQWFINIYRVPELRGRPLLPLDFDDNGKSLHPPTPAIPAISLSRKDDGILVFTLGPEAYDQYPNRPLAIYLNGERKLTSQLLPDSATNAPAAPEPHAESAEAKPHAETAESAEPRPGEAGPLPEGAAERSEAGGVSHAESAEGAE
jgi:hypothetical protein